MVSPNEDSPSGFTRRALFKLPWYCWLTSLFLKQSLAEAVFPEGYTDAGGSIFNGSGETTSLNGIWSLTYGTDTDALKGQPVNAPPANWPTIPATVPGNVELDLIAAGHLEPLEKGERVYLALGLESNQWWYRRIFNAEQKAQGGRAELVFDGLDCLATVWVNGVLVGQPANMLIQHRFDVTSVLLHNRTNEVVVRIDPAVPAGLAVPRSALERSTDGHWESLSVRKAPHMYGWDIMPRIISAGLWRDVRLEYSTSVRFSSVRWFTRTVDVDRASAVASIDWEIDSAHTEHSGYKIEVVLSREGRTVFRSETRGAATKGQIDCSLKDVELWWPRGYGQAPLYDATVILRTSNGKTLARHHSRIGIRTITLDHSEIVTPETPGQFGFTVNGVPIFVRGANWSPLDGLHSRDSKHVEEVFPMLVELNCNMVRCWGGNVYESDRFFDLCDQAGIMVWQDFAMACAVYPQDDAFLEVIAQEAKSVIERLRNHPSLALWSGNNEGDDAWVSRSYAGATPVDPGRDRVTRNALPAVLEKLDPLRPYLPSSPYHSSAAFAAGNDSRLLPEVHLWGPRGYFKAPFYADTPAHFVSEIGYHGCPARSSLEKMFDPEFVHPWKDGHVWNDQWLTKSVRFRLDSNATEGRNDLMIKQISAFFDSVPDSLDEFILASQICQAEALKFFIDLWRQQKGSKRGIVWWNLRDGWPIVSDSVVDYYNTRKLAFHFIQRAQRNVQAICCEAEEGSHSIAIVNDTLGTARGHIEVRKTGGAKKLFEAQFEAEPNGVIHVGSLPHPEQIEMWQIDWSVEGRTAYSSHYLAASGPISLAQYKKWMKPMGLSIEP